MARQAVLKLQTGWGGPSVQLRLSWAWMPQNDDICFWWCEPGYLSAASGRWEARALEKNIMFWDNDDNALLWCLSVNNDYTGYPFTDLEGETGPFQRLSRGGILENGHWTFLEV